jgi:hypothetical protein
MTLKPNGMRCLEDIDKIPTGSQQKVRNAKAVSHFFYVVIFD